MEAFDTDPNDRTPDTLPAEPTTRAMLSECLTLARKNAVEMALIKGMIGALVERVTTIDDRLRSPSGEPTSHVCELREFMRANRAHLAAAGNGKDR